MVQWLAVGAANRDYPEDDLDFHMIALSTDLEVLRRIIPASGSCASSCEPGVRLGVSLHCRSEMRARVSFVRSTCVAQHACFPGAVRTRALLTKSTGTDSEGHQDGHQQFSAKDRERTPVVFTGACFL